MGRARAGVFRHDHDGEGDQPQQAEKIMELRALDRRIKEMPVGDDRKDPRDIRGHRCGNRRGEPKPVFGTQPLVPVDPDGNRQQNDQEIQAGTVPAPRDFQVADGQKGPAVRCANAKRVQSRQNDRARQPAKSILRLGKLCQQCDKAKRKDSLPPPQTTRGILCWRGLPRHNSLISPLSSAIQAERIPRVGIPLVGCLFIPLHT